MNEGKELEKKASEKGHAALLYLLHVIFFLFSFCK